MLTFVLTSYPYPFTAITSNSIEDNGFPVNSLREGVIKEFVREKVAESIFIRHSLLFMA